MDNSEITRPAPKQPIPADAKKVFSGILFDAYQWQQQRFDGSTATYERLRRNDAVIVIPVTPEGKIIVLREQQPGTDWYTAVPCGGIETGEAPAAAARRELLEETGYAPASLDFWYAEQLEHRVDWAVFVFVARGCTKAAAPQDDGGERIEAREVSLEEFFKIATQDDFQNINLGTKLLKAAIDPSAMAALKARFGIAG